VRIRLARPSDADTLYRICLRTGDHGQDATGTYADPRLLAEVYVGPYLALAPDLAFVLADADDVPVGYVLGVADTAGFEARCATEWWPVLRERYPLGQARPGTPDAAIVRLIHEPPVADPALAAHFSAHLHVDLLPAAQGGGHGRRLLETLFDALRARGVRGVHLGVSAHNPGAIAFYRHLGFQTHSAVEHGATLTLPLT
jgi:ribosomal protein S18 acetylase RimI-like enzyme